MAQNVVIAGASFSNVPSIRVPDENNVYHSFVDPSPTTATDSDVASGKVYFKADGTQSTGTATAAGGSDPSDWEIVVEPSSAVGTAIVGTAETEAPNYTPGGDVVMDYEIVGKKLYIKGFRFLGSGTKLILQEVE